MTYFLCEKMWVIRRQVQNTGHRSQVIVLGCFSIGKTMTCDLGAVTCVLYLPGN